MTRDENKSAFFSFDTTGACGQGKGVRRRGGRGMRGEIRGENQEGGSESLSEGVSATMSWCV